jgi:uncharacterized membrane protein YqiK
MDDMDFVTSMLFGVAAVICVIAIIGVWFEGDDE